MKKKFGVVLLVLLMMFAFVGCGNNDDVNGDLNEDGVVTEEDKTTDKTDDKADAQKNGDLDRNDNGNTVRDDMKNLGEDMKDGVESTGDEIKDGVDDLTDSNKNNE